MKWEKEVQAYDDRREIVIPGNKEETITYATEQFIEVANEAIAAHDYFAVALSGGSTPKAIFQSLSSDRYKDQIDWSKVLLFWSDERAVPADHPDSNYRMAMDAGLSKLPIKPDHIFRMKGEGDVEENALEYEKLIQSILPNGIFDLVMLGMGDDGHTASLFPKTHALHSDGRLAVANFLPEKEVWRLTLTYSAINSAREVFIYVLGEGKAEILERVLSEPYDPDNFPIQRVGTPKQKALFIADTSACTPNF